MTWQTALIALAVTSLASLDLSALASMTSELAADLVLALAASQVGLAALWCALGSGPKFVRLSLAGLLVNTWSTALGPFGHQMAMVLLVELGVVFVAGTAWRFFAYADVNGETVKMPGPRRGQFTLADMLALSAVVGLMLGPLPALVGTGGKELKLLGAAFGCQILVLAWVVLYASGKIDRLLLSAAAALLPALMAEGLVGHQRAMRSALLTALMTIGMLAIVRMCERARLRPSRGPLDVLIDPARQEPRPPGC